MLGGGGILGAILIFIITIRRNTRRAGNGHTSGRLPHHDV